MKNPDPLNRIKRCIKNMESVMESNNRDIGNIMNTLGTIIESIKGEDEEPGKVEKRINLTYFVDPALVRKLKILALSWIGISPILSIRR